MVALVVLELHPVSLAQVLYMQLVAVVPEAMRALVVLAELVDQGM
jgi:hypothetical protein